MKLDVVLNQYSNNKSTYLSYMRKWGQLFKKQNEFSSTIINIIFLPKLEIRFYIKIINNNNNLRIGEEELPTLFFWPRWRIKGNKYCHLVILNVFYFYLIKTCKNYAI